MQANFYSADISEKSHPPPRQMDQFTRLQEEMRKQMEEQAEQIEKVEGRMEREVSRHDISLGLGCILLKTVAILLLAGSGHTNGSSGPT